VTRQKIAVITGAGSGIGVATARELAARDYLVVATDIDEQAARRTAAAVAGHAKGLDVTAAVDSRRVAAEVAQELGGLDVWVSNAGISRMRPFLEVTPEELDRTLTVNAKGPFLCGQAAAATMIASGTPGVIVNVASMAGKQGRVPFLADYVASKFAVVGLTPGMAFELAPQHIRVNSVCPGYVNTPMQERELGWEAHLRGTTPAAVRQSWIDDTPLGRLEEPEDVARAIAFLAGPDAAFLTGEALAVNGGAYMD